MDTIPHPFIEDDYIEPQTIVDYIMANPSKKKTIDLAGLSDLEAVNKAFNTALKKQIDKKLKLPFTYQLGLPSDALLSAGLPHLQILLNGSKLSQKSNQKEHRFALIELMDLAKNLHQPIMVFKSSTVKNTFLVLIENYHQKKAENFIVVIRKIKEKLFINMVVSVYTRTNKQILSAIKEKHLLWVDIKKALQWIEPLGVNSVVANQRSSPLLITTQCKDIINNFKNKIINKNNLDGLSMLSPANLETNNAIIDISKKGDLGAWLNGYEKQEYAIVLRGDKGAGKTRLLHQLIDFFAGEDNNKIAFFSLEQHKDSGIAKDLLKTYISTDNLKSISMSSDLTTIDTIDKVAKSGTYKVIAIDSWGKIQNAQQSDFDLLRKKYPSIIWLLIFQSTTGKIIRGGNQPEYDASVVIQVNKGGQAIQEKNRYGNTDKIFSVFDKKIINNAEKCI